MGETAWQDDAALNHFAFRALVEFLKEPMFRPFDARIDDHLAGDPSALSPAEKRGLEVFKVSGKCADCHLLQTEAWPQALLSDYGYDNLGVPSSGPKDPGRGAITGVSEELGQFRAPSLRNVALTAPYMHNGSIATLREVMEFYNRRDKEPERWGQTDYPETVNHDDFGDLGLTDGQIDDLVALMDAFTDRTLLRQQEKKAEFPDAAPNARPTSDLRVAFPDPFFHLKSGTPEASFRGE